MPARNLSQFRNKVASTLGLDNTASSADQTLIDEWLNEGVEQVLLDTQCRIREKTLNLVDGAQNYTLPTDIMAITDVFNTDANGERWPFEPVNLDEMNRLRRNTGIAPARFYCIKGDDLLMVYPTPVTGESITVYYVPTAGALSATDDTPSELPGWLHKAVEYYALAEGADYDDDSASEDGKSYRMLYEGQIRRAKKRLKQKQGSKIPRAIPNRSRVRRLPRDNSRDVW